MNDEPRYVFESLMRQPRVQEFAREQHAINQARTLEMIRSLSTPLLLESLLPITPLDMRPRARLSRWLRSCRYRLRSAVADRLEVLAETVRYGSP